MGDSNRAESILTNQIKWEFTSQLDCFGHFKDVNSQRYSVASCSMAADSTDTLLSCRS